MEHEVHRYIGILPQERLIDPKQQQQPIILYLEYNITIFYILFIYLLIIIKNYIELFF